jgi:hypothetical protein
MLYSGGCIGDHRNRGPNTNKRRGEYPVGSSWQVPRTNYKKMAVGLIGIAHISDMLMEKAGDISRLVTYALTTPPSILIRNCAFFGESVGHMDTSPHLLIFSGDNIFGGN